MERMNEFIKKKRINEKLNHKQLKYGMRKLSSGVVSCILGFVIIGIPIKALASENLESKSNREILFTTLISPEAKSISDTVTDGPINYIFNGDIDSREVNSNKEVISIKSVESNPYIAKLDQTQLIKVQSENIERVKLRDSSIYDSNTQSGLSQVTVDSIKHIEFTDDSLLNTLKIRVKSTDIILEAVKLARADGYAKFIDLTQEQQEVYKESAKKNLLKDKLDANVYIDSFNRIKEDINSYIIKYNISSKNSSLIEENKHQFVLGLAYFEKLYNIDIPDKSATLKDKLFENISESELVNVLIRVGSQPESELSYIRIPYLYENIIAKEFNKDATLDKFIKSAIGEDKIDQWFKDNLKIINHISSDLKIGVFNKFSSDYITLSHVLPLLNLERESIYMIVTEASITYGLYDTYVSEKSEEGALETKVKEVGKAQEDHMDIWKTLSNNKVPYKNTIVKDALRVKEKGENPYEVNILYTSKNQWASKYQTSGLKEFFTPLNMYRDFQQSGAEAEIPNDIRMFINRALDDRGLSAYTHEMIHLYTSEYLQGNRQRLDTGQELLPRGILESCENDDPYFGLNLIYNNRKWTNTSYERFTEGEDIKESIKNYLNKQLDLIYSLEIIEGEEILKRQDKKDFLKKLEPTLDSTSSQFLDKFTNNVPDDLTSIHDLVDQNLVVKRYYYSPAINQEDTAFKNGYHSIPLFSSFYAAPENPNGSVGDVSLRRLAFEILAEYGYDNGFVPYLSNKYMINGNLTDSMIITKIFGNEYKSMKEFKKAMIDRRQEKLGNLKQVNFTYNNESYTQADIRSLMAKALEADKTYNGYYTESNVEKLKRVIYESYKQETNDFRDTIYNIEDVIVNKETDSESRISDKENVTSEAEQLNKVTNGSFDKNYGSSETEWRTKKGGQGNTDNTEEIGEISSGTSDDFILQKIPTTIGVKYRVDVDIKTDKKIIDKGIYFTAKLVKDNGTQGKVLKQENVIQEAGSKHYSFEFIAESSETFIGLVKWAENRAVSEISNINVMIDNVSVHEEEKYDLVWYDDFSEEELDSSIWGYELGNIRGNEQQHYSSSKENVYLDNGKLILKITERSKQDKYKNTKRLGSSAREVKYNSGSVRTEGKQEFLYGRIEARMKLPKGKGVFPAFWMLGADFHMDGRVNPKHGYDWPSTGEIDIMEMIGTDNEEGKANSNRKVYGTPHFYYSDAIDSGKDGSYGYISSTTKKTVVDELGGNLSINDDFYDSFHIFGINWTPDYIEWYVDGIVYNRIKFSDPNDPDNDKRLKAAAKSLNRPQYLQLNLATGGNWVGDAGDNLEGQKLEIDWVRYLQTDKQKEVRSAYYQNQPVISGVKDIVMVEGQMTNLLEGIETNMSTHKVEYSIDNEYSFINGGAPDGRNEVSAIIYDSSEAELLKNLKPGIYNIHYSAIPNLVSTNGQITPEQKITRKTVTLTVLPSGGLIGKNGSSLSTIQLPQGWSWKNPNQIIGNADSYVLIYTNSADTTTSSENRRRYEVLIPKEYITESRTAIE